ncbi:MAG: hypothetical protein H6673_13845 [Anaerolineales bacterium]|nr:hypothetical protein [Anaerolineales bacterium]
MGSRRKVDVSTQEWRWVAFWGGVFVTITFLPYALAMFASNDTWHFLGMLGNPKDGAPYFAKIRQGIQGNWLYDFRYTPETHDSAGLFTFYLLLGHLARLLGFSNFVIFHLARIAASLFMLTAFYQFGATVWQRLRPRRMFFAITTVASGLGWLVLPLVPDNGVFPPDIGIPEAFPLYASFVNPHFPFIIGCLTLMAATLLSVFRPGFSEAPTVDNGGLQLILLSVLISIVQPPAMIGIGAALVVFIFLSSYINHSIPWHEVRWGAMVWLPAFPVAIYYILVFQTSSIVEEFNKQNITPSPNIFFTLMSFGILLFIAFPGIARAVRRFERDGDQLMLLWLIANLIAIYTPYSLQRRFFIGLIIPFSFFAVRAVEDYWSYHIAPRWQRVTMVVALILIFPSHFITLGIPLYGAISDREAGANAGLVAGADYIAVYDWLEEVGQVDEVVLAAPNISLWIPSRTDLRVVYGHPFETVPADTRLKQVEDFYSGRDCTALFNENLKFQIDYVVWGSEERQFAKDIQEDNPNQSHSDCIAQMVTDQELTDDQIRIFGDVTLYTLRELR